MVPPFQLLLNICCDFHVKSGSEISRSCLTLCEPMDCSPPGSSVHGILQARILDCVAMPSSRDLPNPGIEPRSPAFQADSLLSEPPGKPRKLSPNQRTREPGKVISYCLERAEWAETVGSRQANDRHTGG